MNRPLLRRISILLLFTSPTWAAPTGGALVGGAASIDQSVAGQTTITQSTDRAIINWQSFSTGASEAVRFVQPAASSVTLNRVTGSSASSLDGSLTANGRVFILNPNGIVFGRNARVDVGGLVASSLAMSDSDFMRGRHELAAPAGHAPGAVVNKGTITTHAGGSVALVAPVVSNQGTISAPGGRVALAAGSRAVVSLDEGQLVTLAVSTEPPKDVKVPEGWIDEAVTTAVNNDHLVAASSVRVENGTVTLGAAEGLAHNGGTVRADGAPALAAGTVRVEGTRAALLSAGAELGADAAGAGTRGGDVRLLGAKVAVAERGSRISARGGEGGRGGFIEISGESITPAGTVDARAAGGKSGQILLDPINLRITEGPTAGDDLNESDLNTMLMAGDVILEATHSITFASNTLDETGIENGGTGNSLTLRVTSGAGGINVDPAVSNPAFIDLSGGATLTLDAGIGGINLYRGLGMGGTNIIASNIILTAAGTITTATLDAASSGSLFVESLSGSILVGSDQQLSAGTMDLLAAGSITNHLGGPASTITYGGLLRLTSQIPNASILVDEDEIPAVLQLEFNQTVAGLSSIVVRGNVAQSPVDLARQSNGTFFGTGMAGNDLFMFNAGTAPMGLAGITAGFLVAGGTAPVSVLGNLSTDFGVSLSSSATVGIEAGIQAANGSIFVFGEQGVSNNATLNAGGGQVFLVSGGTLVNNGAIFSSDPNGEGQIVLDSVSTLIAGGTISSAGFADLFSGSDIVMSGTMFAQGDSFISARGSIFDGNGSALNLSTQSAKFFANGTVGASDAIEVNLTDGGLAVLAKGRDASGVSARFAGNVVSGEFVAIDATGLAFLNDVPARPVPTVLSAVRLDPEFAAEIWGQEAADQALLAIATQNKALARQLIRLRVVEPGISAPLDLASPPPNFAAALAAEGRAFDPPPPPPAPVVVAPPPPPPVVLPPPPAPVAVAPPPAPIVSAFAGLTPSPSGGAFGASAFAAPPSAFGGAPAWSAPAATGAAIELAPAPSYFAPAAPSFGAVTAFAATPYTFSGSPAFGAPAAYTGPISPYGFSSPYGGPPPSYGLTSPYGPVTHATFSAAPAPAITSFAVDTGVAAAAPATMGAFGASKPANTGGGAFGQL
jgi:filamentous hemagglutinin family protein